MDIYDNVISRFMAGGGGGGGGGGSSWDAVIRLVHAENSGIDIPDNLTASIVSGTFAQLSNKMRGGGYPCVLVEYYHPFGVQFSAPMAYALYRGDEFISFGVAGPSPSEGLLFKKFGDLLWNNDDTLAWE